MDLEIIWPNPFLIFMTVVVITIDQDRASRMKSSKMTPFLYNNLTFISSIVRSDHKQRLKLRKRPNSECEDFAEEWATQFIWECPTKFMLARSVRIFTWKSNREIIWTLKSQENHQSIESNTYFNILNVPQSRLQMRKGVPK